MEVLLGFGSRINSLRIGLSCAQPRLGSGATTRFHAADDFDHITYYYISAQFTCYYISVQSIAS